MTPEKITVIEKKIDRILFYLEDDVPTGMKGVVSTLNAHGKRIEKLEETHLVGKAKVAGLSAGIGGIAGATMGKIWAWLTHVTF